MEKQDAAPAFAMLGHPGRLDVFRLLMRFAPRGVRPTEIAAALGLKQNTLSHHLADLAACGLVQAERQGRSLFYSVNLEMTEGLIGFLALDVGRARPDLLNSVLATARTPRAKAGRAFNVLFLCTRNSARSIMAEAILRDLGAGRFTAHSAGLHPALAPHPAAIEVLTGNGHSATGLRSKHLDLYQENATPEMDFIFTVCDLAAAEDCPRWPGQPITAHWGLPDPVTAVEQGQAFELTYAALHSRIAEFVALPLHDLSRLAQQAQVDAIHTHPKD